VSAPAGSKGDLLYLFGIAGHPEWSPAMKALTEDGWNVVAPSVPGFDGKTGFIAPDGYIDWLTTFWDAIDATGIGPCPVVGASVGGIFAAELAAFRPERVTKLALLAPFGICDGDNPGLDLYALPAGERMGRLFAKGTPPRFDDRFGELGAEEAPVARYLSDIAAASILWPFGEVGLAKRLHRITAPRLTVFGDLDELIPVGTGARWGEHHVIAGAGHLLEWDTPEEATALLRTFLA
jgi:abhydrolase domain-containing protein 6